MTFWARSSQFPPLLVRLLARRRHGPPLTDEQIAAASGLSTMHVFTISQALTWEGIDLPTMRKFLTACQVDFENPKQMERVRQYLKNNPSYQYLRTSPHWRTFYQPLMNKLRCSPYSKMIPK